MAEAKVKIMQDVNELTAVAMIQSLFEEREVAYSEDSSDKWEALEDYVNARPILGGMKKVEKSIYYKNCEKHMPDFVDRLIDKYPHLYLDVEDVEAEYRNQNLKGDFVIRGYDGDDEVLTISFSLKNYKGGCKTIQCCSGTFNSFALNFTFEQAGVGSYLDPHTGKKFVGRDIDKRDTALKAAGKPGMIDSMHMLDEINYFVKDKYVNGEEARMWENIEDQWKEDCHTYGMMAIEETLTIIENNFSGDEIITRLLKMTGFDGVEELLVMDNKNCVDSLTDPKMIKLIKGLRDDNTYIEYYQHGKSIRFDFVNDGVTLLDVTVPFTLNSNGAWYKDPKEGYEGTIYHPKEKMELAWGERRPKKSSELNSSINTYVNLGATGVFN